MVHEMTPTGSERVSKTRGFRGSAGDVPPSAAIGAHHGDPGAEELLGLWATLDDAQRADLLAVAPGVGPGIGRCPMLPGACVTGGPRISSGRGGSVVLSELQSRDDRVTLRAKPVLKFHPGYGCILMCDFSHQAVPEMVKTRPVVVISRKAANSQLCTVVPLSSTEPDPKHPWHAKMTREKMPTSLRGKECWAKCDCVATVSFARLNRNKTQTPPNWGQSLQ